ncbi:gliding motility-associated C-terminal domain-containing protein [Chitinophaga sp. MM2321]|uniref:T9SS type B sorting domain-containing protein n=1 Tax=Chitinophaga sp. MM2321 TaxID=3137178 RepID=UPI0032D5A8D3
MPFFLVTVFNIHLFAQDIEIKNPSLEGPPRAAAAPPSWYIINNSPDIQPGCCSVSQPASDGDTYIGMISSSEWAEGVSQKLSKEIIAGKTYSFSMDLAYPPVYFGNKICDGAFIIYGGDAIGGKNEILWKSDLFFHTGWRRYTAIFTATRNYKFISLCSYFTSSCTDGKFSAVLVDNLSLVIREIPRIVLTVQNTCKGTNTGSASVAVLGGPEPYTFNWAPGGQTTNQINNLPAGNHEVMVTGANGAMATAAVTIRETILQHEVTVSSSPCNGDEQNKIILNTTGGAPPYRYYLNDAPQPSYTATFKALRPGNYAVVVKDDHGCEDKIQNIQLTEPPPLQIAAVSKKDISCNETTDGRIALDITGGTTPYSYSLEPGNWQPDSVWKQLDVGRYYFQVKDKNDCLVRGSAEILKHQRDCAVFVPTAFSPNGDGKNDLFRAKVHDDISQYRLVVYNRWGTPVFQSNDPRAAWDGNQQPAGSYVWVLTYTDSKKQGRKELGNLVLVR